MAEKRAYGFGGRLLGPKPVTPEELDIIIRNLLGKQGSIEDIMNNQSANKAATTATPPINWLEVAAQAGSTGLGLLSEYMGGSEARQGMRDVEKMATDVFNEPSMVSPGRIGQRTGLAMENLKPAIQGRARGVSTRLGLDSGAAQKAIMQTESQARSNILGQIIPELENMDLRKRLSALEIISQLKRTKYMGL